MIFLRILLLPISYLYGFIVAIRNLLFYIGIIPSKKFNVPIISVGNLSTGGTGKTPQIEYLVRLLQKDHQVAVLSRGYQRTSKGFILLNTEHTSIEVGDEPRQYCHKFPDIMVGVDERRSRGIQKLLELNPNLDVILLDDAFQHRSVKPGLSILLTDFHSLYSSDHPLPSGNLREFKCGANRADIIIVSKTPNVFSPITQRNLLDELKPKDYQKVFFSYIKYRPLIALSDKNVTMKEEGLGVILVTGIVNPAPLKEYIERKTSRLIHLEYNDHHRFTPKDVENIIKTYNDFYSGNKIIITTEKDVMRFLDIYELDQFLALPVFFTPIETEMHKEFKQEFDLAILNYVSHYSTSKRLHQ